MEELAGIFMGVAETAKGLEAAFTEVASIAAGALKDSFGSITSGIAQVAGAVAPFVQALNPGLMLQFNQVFRDLMATIGVAVQPVIQVLTDFARQMGGVLLPLMEALAPIVANLSQAVANVLLPVIGVWVEIFRAMAPILEVLSGVVRLLAEVLMVYYTVAKAVVQTLAQFVAGLMGGVNLKDVFAHLRQVIHEVLKALVQLVAFIGRAMGQMGFVHNLGAAFHQAAGQSGGVKAAPLNAGVSDFSSIAKEMAASAFVAQGGGPQGKTEKEYLEDLAKAVGEIKDGKSFESFLREELAKLGIDLKGSLEQERRAMEISVRSGMNEYIWQPIINASNMVIRALEAMRFWR